jgi:hypothetical protein
MTGGIRGPVLIYRWLIAKGCLRKKKEPGFKDLLIIFVQLKAGAMRCHERDARGSGFKFCIKTNPK